MSEALRQEPGGSGVFASVANPDFKWEEIAVNKSFGLTEFPDDPGGVAKIYTPAADTPLARAIKLHELLHARFTPDISGAVIKRGGFASEAAQIAEDIRLSGIANKLDLYKDDAYYPLTAWRKEFKGAKDAAMSYMAGYGQPSEGWWNTRSFKKFCRKAGIKRFPAKVERVLKHWEKQVSRTTHTLDPKEQFEELMNHTEEALKALDDISKGKKPQEPDKNKPKTKASGGDSEGEGAGGDGDPDEQKREGDDKEDKGSKKKKDDAPDKEAEGKKDKAKGGGKQPKESIPFEAEAQDGNENDKSEAPPEPQVPPTPPKHGGWLPPRILRSPSASLQQAMEKMEAPLSMPGGGGVGGRGEGRYASEKGFGPLGARLGPRPDKKTAENYCLDPERGAWCPMDTRLAPLERNFKARVIRNGVASPDGPMPRLFNRWYGDKHIFERKGKRLGGSLLIDISGSMSWSREQLKAMIDKVPAMTVAMYSSTNTSDNKGFLTIIAKDGKLVSEDFCPYKNCGGLKPHGTGNSVDGPALSWLARQARPRVWFSDGEVTGTGDIPRENLYEDAKRICRLGAIRVTRDPGKLLGMFTGRA